MLNLRRRVGQSVTVRDPLRPDDPTRVLVRDVFVDDNGESVVVLGFKAPREVDINRDERKRPEDRKALDD